MDRLDYALLYVNEVQKQVNPALAAAVRRHGTLVFRLVRDGIDYGSVYRIDR